MDASNGCHEEGGGVTCTFQGPDDFTQIALLPNDTKKLVVIFPEEPVSRVRNLHLNHLGDLEELTFQPPSSFSDVCLSPSGLVGEELFDGLVKLKELRIHLCLARISPGLLRNLTSLEVLDLSYTKSFDIDNLSEILASISDAQLPVHTLNLTAIRVVEYPSELRSIELRNDIYRHVGNLPLRALDLRQNAIIEYKPGLRQFAPDLEILRIESTAYGNFLSDLEAVCASMDVAMHQSLKEVELSILSSTVEQRRIRRSITGVLTDALFRCVSESTAPCDIVNCACRGITSFACTNRPLPVDAISELFATEHSNCIGNLNIPLPRTLQHLTFKYPPLFNAYSVRESARDFCIQPNNELRSLDVSSNRLGLFLLHHNVTSYGLNKLEYINLRNNLFHFEPFSKFLHHMPSLKVVLLRDNTVSFGSENNGTELFRDSPNIEILELANCGIMEIPHLEVLHLTKLTELDLSMNNLQEFDLNLDSLKQLQLLNLSGNRLQTLPQRVTDHLEMLTSHNLSQRVVVDLSQNPLMCQCNNLDFVRWIQTTKVHLARKEGLTCMTGEISGQVSPFDLNLNDLHNTCIRLPEILGFTLALVGLAAVTIIGYYVYRKRWRLTYWIHTARETWRRRMETDTGDEKRQYVYDAFVAYSTHGQERSWVHLTLREKLENEYGFKLCIHYRDFKLGRAIDECIVEAINKSRKTILVLSPEFLKSGWCQFEVRMASEKLIEERRDTFVIVIFRPLDEPGTRIPKKLVRLLEKKIYVEWTQDPTGQKLFWDRLAHVLKEDEAHVDPFRTLAEA